MKTAKSLPKIRLLKNKFGIILGIKYGDTLLRGITEVNISCDKRGLPKINLSMITTDLEFETLNSTRANLRDAMADDAANKSSVSLPEV